MTRERPILFSGPMVRAILTGRKTVTRRVMKIRLAPGQRPDEEGWEQGLDPDLDLWFGCATDGTTLIERCPYGAPGDRLWVKETHALLPKPDLRLHGNTKRALRPDELTPVYAASFNPDSPRPRWRPSIHMPRWASRLTLDVVSVGVERLHDITNAEIAAEGVIADRGPRGEFLSALRGPTGGTIFETARALWQHGWDSINGKRPSCAWKDNPWVWRVEFRRAETAP